METKNKKQNDLPKRTFNDFDKLNLKSFAENLFNNIEQGVSSTIGEQGAYTISLNAEFGNGKTTFLKMFQNFIEDKKKNQNYKVISINAWEADFYSEPIVAILSEFVDLIKKNETEKDNQKEIINKITKIIEKLVNYRTTRLVGNTLNQVIYKKTGFNIRTLFKIITLIKSFFDKKNLENSNQDKKERRVLEELNQIKSAVKDIKQVISKYIQDKKLLIIVDELDRARPDYAVHFLEDIKHFFDIKNVIFLVAVNRQQMEATVKCLYGQNLNFDGYYRKFFKQEINLPDPYKEAQRFVDDLIRNTKINFDRQRNDRDYRVSDAYLSCKLFSLTLREIEGFIRTFEQLLASETHIARWVEMNCYSFFICLFLKEKEEFNKILVEGYKVDDFFKFVDQKGFEYDFEQESEKIKRKEKYNVNYLLGQVSCSFIENRNQLEDNNTKIKEKFKAVEDISRIIQFNDPRLGLISGLKLDYGQPASIICNIINNLKPVFNE